MSPACGCGTTCHLVALGVLEYHTWSTGVSHMSQSCSCTVTLHCMFGAASCTRCALLLAPLRHTPQSDDTVYPPALLRGCPVVVPLHVATHYHHLSPNHAAVPTPRCRLHQSCLRCREHAIISRGLRVVAAEHACFMYMLYCMTCMPGNLATAFSGCHGGVCATVHQLVAHKPVHQLLLAHKPGV